MYQRKHKTFGLSHADILKYGAIPNTLKASDGSWIRFMMVGAKPYSSKNWITFHDFLYDYLQEILGKDWFLINQNHPIIEWNNALKNKGGLEIPTGATNAYLHLSYNLFLMEQFKILNGKFIKRLKDPDHFHGTQYEAFVTSCFIKAGFKLTIPKNKNGEIGEFIAQKNGKTFEIEAKARAESNILGKENLEIGPNQIKNILNRALSKKLSFPKIIFLDLNEDSKNVDIKKIGIDIEKIQEGDKNEREAFIFITNNPCHYFLEETDFYWHILMFPYNIKDLIYRDNLDPFCPNIIQDKYPEVFSIGELIKDHWYVPLVFPS